MRSSPRTPGRRPGRRYVPLHAGSAVDARRGPCLLGGRDERSSLEELHGLGDALQFERADLQESETLRWRDAADEVGQHRRLVTARRLRTYPGFIERGLDVPELVLRIEALGVTSIQPAQHLLAGVAHTDAHFAASGFERFVIAEASAPEGSFDRV